MACISLLSGCASVDTLQPDAGGTTFSITGKNYNEIWNASVKSVSRNLTIVDSNKGAAQIRAEKGVGLTTWGEVAGVFISPTTPTASSYQITVQSMKRLMTQITGQDWTQNIVLGIRAELGQ